MQNSYGEWRLLRTKTDEAVADPDWAGTNATPTEPVGGAAITVGFASLVEHHGPAVTGVEVIVLGVDASRVPVAKGANVCDLSFVEVIVRTKPGNGGTAGDAVLVADCSSASTTAVPLNRKVYFDLNGGELFTIRITGNTGIAGVDRLQVWYRGVVR